jgi:hypothetical protein
MITEYIKCEFCRSLYPVQAPASEWARWYSERPLVQNCFPNMPAGQRELLVSGTCDDCWNDMFRGME